MEVQHNRISARGWLSDFPRMSVGEDDEIDVWFSSRKIMQVEHACHFGR